MTKKFVAKPGDKWTHIPKDAILYRYREDECVFFRPTHNGVTQLRRQSEETDLLTPDAHAQLREWGYEVSGDQPASDEQPLTEARVREIVAEMLAAHPTPAEVREAAKVASDPKTVWIPPTDDGEISPVYRAMTFSIKCVNALAGVADPAAQVAKWRAIEAAARRVVEEESDSTWQGLKAALAAKGGE